MQNKFRLYEYLRRYVSLRQYIHTYILFFNNWDAVQKTTKDHLSHLNIILFKIKQFSTYYTFELYTEKCRHSIIL